MPTKTKSRRRTKKGKTNAQVYQMVTDRVIEALKQDLVPWQKPWRVEGGFHKNLISKKSYQSSNRVLLDVTCLLESYRSPWWVTFKQAKILGGTVKGGETGTQLTYWNMIEGKEKVYNEKTGEWEIPVYPMLKTFTVFNIEQTEGIDPKKVPAVEKELKFTPVKRADRMLKGYAKDKKAPKVFRGGNRASYHPIFDLISVPRPEQFKSVEEYYATLFHEEIHATGHSERLSRKEVVRFEKEEDRKFGDGEYSEEELTAELGAAFLCALVDIDSVKQQENSAAYIKKWIERLEDNPKLIIGAGSKAQKAADYIAGVKGE